jgi:hypothetical protein
VTTDQPTDEWDYLAADDELETPDDRAPRDELPAEEQALHVEHPGTRRPTDDPGVAEVAVGAPESGVPVTYFDDEHPEHPVPTRAPDHEPDLEEILESQHYAFDATAVDLDEG